jgi:hypothetical protein
VPVVKKIGIEKFICDDSDSDSDVLDEEDEEYYDKSVLA